MTVDMVLRTGAIGLPLAGALAIRLWGTRSPRLPRRLAVFILGATGLLALALFVLNRYDACILAFGRESCLFEGLATLSLLLLGGVCARGCILRRDADMGQHTISILLLCGAWAGIGLAQNLGLLLVFLNLFFFAVDRWLRGKGLVWRFLALRDDYADEER